jgi:hypothetical protein
MGFDSIDFIKQSKRGGSEEQLNEAHSSASGEESTEIDSSQLSQLGDSSH